MTPQQYVVMAAGFLGLCTIGLLTHSGALTISNPGAGALTGARAMLHAELERWESAVPAGRRQDDGRWNAYLRLVDEELSAGHIDVAVRVWHDAYGAALESRNWESMIAVGDAFMRIGRAAGTPNGARMNAREAYMTALIRARRVHSVEGALRSAQAFRDLGDRAIVEQCLYIASQLAGGDDRAQKLVREARQGWAGADAVAEF